MVNWYLNKFPAETTVYSPYLFKQKINQDTTISQLSLWNTGGSSSSIWRHCDSTNKEFIALY